MCEEGFEGPIRVMDRKLRGQLGRVSWASNAEGLWTYKKRAIPPATRNRRVVLDHADTTTVCVYSHASSTVMPPLAVAGEAMLSRAGFEAMQAVVLQKHARYQRVSRRRTKVSGAAQKSRADSTGAKRKERRMGEGEGDERGRASQAPPSPSDAWEAAHGCLESTLRGTTVGPEAILVAAPALRTWTAILASRLDPRERAEPRGSGDSCFAEDSIMFACFGSAWRGRSALMRSNLVWRCKLDIEVVQCARTGILRWSCDIYYSYSTLDSCQAVN